MRFATTFAGRFAYFARSPTSALRFPTRTFGAFVASTWTEFATASTTESARAQFASRYWRSGIRAAAQDRGCSRPDLLPRRALQPAPSAIYSTFTSLSPSGPALAFVGALRLPSPRVARNPMASPSIAILNRLGGWLREVAALRANQGSPGGAGVRG